MHFGRNAVVLAGVVLSLLLPHANMARAEDDVAQLKAQLAQLNARLEKVESQRTNQIEKDELARMMKEILDDAKASPALPEWMKNLTFAGDLRMRAEHQMYNGSRGGDGSANNPLIGERKDRNRIRLRLRFGFTKTWWDNQMEVGFRLASGSDNQPASQNQTMTGDFSKKPIWIDLMYAKYKPNWAKGLEVGGGKVYNPIKTRTFITWDGSLNPEGVYVDYVAPFFGDFMPYGQVGFWMVNEDGTRQPDTTLRDTVMMSYSTGFDWKLTDSLGWFFGATYYDWYNPDASTGGWLGRYGPDGQWATGPGGQTPDQNLDGASLPSVDYKLLELTTKFSWKLSFMPKAFQRWNAWATYVHNFQDNYSVWDNPPDAALVGADRHFQDKSNAYGAGIMVGENKKKNDLSLAYAYYYIEYGSVVPGFGDGTFGGPNHQGHMFQAVYNIDDFLTLGGMMVLYQPIHTNDNPANNADSVVFPHSQDLAATFRLELTWKF